LSLLNLHASRGREKYWLSRGEYRRLAGIELVQNRIQMTARLGGNVMILHIPSTRRHKSRPFWLAQIRKSLDQIESFARSYSVCIALENMAGDDWEMLETLFSEYDPAFIGLCYDSGHANLSEHSFEHLNRWKDRLIAIHLHDNDGLTDQHKIPFTGTVDWQGLAQMIASSTYEKCVNLEVVFNESEYKDEDKFLQHAYLAGEKLSTLIKAKQGAQ
jgi:sugar phosphate isomerase/epimerase